MHQALCQVSTGYIYVVSFSKLCEIGLGVPILQKGQEAEAWGTSPLG